MISAEFLRPSHPRIIDLALVYKRLGAYANRRKFIAIARRTKVIHDLTPRWDWIPK
jgi:hypothetical protein